MNIAWSTGFIHDVTGSRNDHDHPHTPTPEWQTHSNKHLALFSDMDKPLSTVKREAASDHILNLRVWLHKATRVHVKYVSSSAHVCQSNGPCWCHMLKTTDGSSMSSAPEKTHSTTQTPNEATSAPRLYLFYTILQIGYYYVYYTIHLYILHGPSILDVSRGWDWCHTDTESVIGSCLSCDPHFTCHTVHGEYHGLLTLFVD